MRIYRIALSLFHRYADDITKYEDPLLKEAALKVVEEGKMIRDVVSEYHFSPAQTDRLSDIVMDMRKMKWLPVDRITQTFDEVRSQPNPTISAVAKKLNIPLADVIWVLRRVRPEIRIQITAKEAKEIIAYKESGLTNDQIAQKYNVSPRTITETLKRHRPDLVKEQRSKEFWNAIHKEYVNLSNQGLPYDVIMGKLMEEHGVDRKNLRSSLYDRGVEAPVTSVAFSPEEEQYIMEKAYAGLSSTQIGVEIGRSRSSVNGIIRRRDPEFYEKHIKKVVVSEEVVGFVIESIKTGNMFQKIVDAVKAKFNFDITPRNIASIKRKYNVVDLTKKRKPRTAEQINDIILEYLRNGMDYYQIREEVFSEIRIDPSFSLINRLDRQYVNKNAEFPEYDEPYGEVLKRNPHGIPSGGWSDLSQYEKAQMEGRRFLTREIAKEILKRKEEFGRDLTKEEYEEVFSGKRLRRPRNKIVNEEEKSYDFTDEEAQKIRDILQGNKEEVLASQYISWYKWSKI